MIECGNIIISGSTSRIYIQLKCKNDKMSIILTIDSDPIELYRWLHASESLYKDVVDCDYYKSADAFRIKIVGVDVIS
jgi:hypothetical protein